MLEFKNITKTYGHVAALRDLTMQVESGELFGIAGPNGAGKTTSLKLAAGLIGADSGTIWLDGKRCSANALRKNGKIGYVPDFFGVYDNLLVQEYMEFYASLYGMTGRESRRKTQELLERMNMSEWKSEMVDSMSRGQKQKLCIARALVNDPDLLVLDEPASGMEPKYRSELRELMRELCAEGKTILISSHNLSELAESCTGIGVIREGRMVLQGNMQELLRQQQESNPYRLQYLNLPEEAMRVLRGNPMVRNITILENSISFPFAGGAEEAAALLAALTAAGAEITAFYREAGSLEKIMQEA